MFDQFGGTYSATYPLWRWMHKLLILYSSHNFTHQFISPNAACNLLLHYSYCAIAISLSATIDINTIWSNKYSLVFNLNFLWCIVKSNQNDEQILSVAGCNQTLLLIAQRSMLIAYAHFDICEAYRFIEHRIWPTHPSNAININNLLI